ncbi:MAG: MBL fold metallo-hydrolase [Sedimentisphaerales bacterium]|nr:MBL fold metallo-hydrolase [Sedimentisphaerales bacterium]
MSEHIYLKWWGCGAFDILTDDVNIAFDPYLFGKNLEKAKPIYDYIFISHEHFDHCHPKSLERLCDGPRFKRLYVCPGCVHPNVPIAENYGHAAVERDLPITKYVAEDKTVIVYPGIRDDRQTGRSWEGTIGKRDLPGPHTLDLGEIEVEVIESGENQRADLTTNGYLVHHRSSGVSLLHIGDLHEPYPELAQLRDRVDFLVHMKVGVRTTGDDGRNVEGLKKLRRFSELIRPRYFIPIHYRTDRLSDPIPPGNWPPDVTDVASFIESMREAIGDLTTILPFTAGETYEVDLPSKKVVWKWQWRNSWEEPTWL